VITAARCTVLEVERETCGLLGRMNAGTATLTRDDLDIKKERD
jgi:hypothetical protein